MFHKIKKLKLKQGFTLIELLVVIAIISLLASVVFASLSSARKKSRDARRIADIKQLQLALELYFDSQGNIYPTAVSGVCTAVAGSAATENYGLQDLVIKGFIPSIPRDPNSSTLCYKYSTVPAPVVAYHIGATLEDPANTALKGDRDCDSSTTGAGACGSVAYTLGFNGLDAAGCSAEAGKSCYDAIP